MYSPSHAASAEAPEGGSLEIRELFGVLLRGKWGILAVTGVVVGAALAFSFRQTPIYASTAKVLVQPPTTNQLLSQVPASSLVSTDTEQQIVRSASVAQIAGQKLSPPVAPAALLNKVSVSVPTNTQILDITYSDPDPLRARAGANAVAAAYLDFKTTQALQAYSDVRSGIQKQIGSVQKQLQAAQANFDSATTAQQRSAARNQIDGLNSEITYLTTQAGTVGVLDINPGEVIEPANLPVSPSSPNILANTAAALFVGVAFGVGLAFLRERLDDGLRGRADLQERLGAPTLAVVPSVKGWEKAEAKLVADPTGAVAEAYRTLRTSVSFLSAQNSLKTLMVTSPHAGEGKSTTTANLAVALAQAGNRVVAVSADLRKPRLHRFFANDPHPVDNSKGLVDILTQEASITDVLQDTHVDGLWILAAGAPQSSPAELLTFGGMKYLIDLLKETSDFVLIDTPPALVVSDALGLAPLVDGVLVVADAQSTSQGAISQTRLQLDQLGGTVIGAVLNRFDPSRARGHPSHYRYYYSYQYQYAEPTPNGESRLGLRREAEKQAGPASPREAP